MTTSNKTEKKHSQVKDQRFLRKVFAWFNALPQKRLLFASIFLHLIFFSLLFMNWQSHETIKPIYIPKNISAHVVNADQIKVLQDKKAAEKLAQKKKILNKQKKEAQRKALLRQKALEKKKAKEAALKKAAEKKKKTQEKKLQLQKQKDLKDKLEKEKRKKEKAMLQKREEKQKLKEAALKRQQIEDKRVAEEQQKRIKEQENKLLERLQESEQKNRLAEQLAEENSKKEQAFLEYELSEKERFTFLIRSKIENLWIKPPKSRGLRVVLRILLLPNGELSSVQISESSGNSAFDRSAVLAVKSVRRFPVPEDSQVFEQNFRQFSMSFSPELI